MKVSNLLLACLHALNMLILVLNDEACSHHIALCRDQHSPVSLHIQIRKRLKRESWVKRVRILDQGVISNNVVLISFCQLDRVIWGEGNLIDLTAKMPPSHWPVIKTVVVFSRLMVNEGRPKPL